MTFFPLIHGVLLRAFIASSRPKFERQPLFYSFECFHAGVIWLYKNWNISVWNATPGAAPGATCPLPPAPLAMALESIKGREEKNNFNFYWHWRNWTTIAFLNFLDSEHLLVFPLISFPIVVKYFYCTELMPLFQLILLIAINIFEKGSQKYYFWFLLKLYSCDWIK